MIILVDLKSRLQGSLVLVTFFSDSVPWWRDNFCFCFFIFNRVTFVFVAFYVVAVFYDTVKKKGKLQMKEGPNGGDGVALVRSMSRLSVQILPLSVTAVTLADTS